jgi:hypothetical protein
MSIREKAKQAARMAARDHGVDARVAKRLLMFWIDAEVISPNAPIDAMVRAVAAYASSSTPCTPTP